MTPTAMDKEPALPKKTKSFVLDGATAAKIEALAEATHQSESAVANRILEAGARQMVVERVPASHEGAPLRAGFGAIEGILCVRRPGETESEFSRQLSFEVVAELTGPADPFATLLAYAFAYDPRDQHWRRLTEQEAHELVATVHGNSRLWVITPAGVRWLVVEARDVLHRGFTPPLRDVVIRLRRLPTLCPACATPLAPSALPAFEFSCPNVVCGRQYHVDPTGNLVEGAGTAAAQGSGPMSFAELRGILPADTFTDEELRAVRTAFRKRP